METPSGALVVPHMLRQVQPKRRAHWVVLLVVVALLGLVAGSRAGATNPPPQPQPTGSQPAQPTGSQPAQPTGSQPAQPTGSQPAQPTGSQPAQPTGSQPAQPTGSQPTGPSPPTPSGSSPGKPDEPTPPTQPAEPAHPTEPTEPKHPPQPGEPDEPTQPSQPSQPTEPAAPPAQPSAPAPPPAPAPLTPAPASPTLPPSPATTPRPQPRAISPFPIVRLRGRILPDGILVDLLSVQAPSGARVKVTCEGPSCHTTSEQRRASAAVLRMRRFERRFQPGATLRISVTMPGRIGKLTIFTFRRTRPPDRHDTCLAVGSVRRAIRCPAG